ncbi:helix-turn-helix domain-containing protein [Streptomyces sp. NPDC057565]|uniref:helix-turn-helix domain-containing protein n=1 Tax=Streptomyces sp. NPDC057565 TaxID=3346169 RepID=UPI0036C129A2
MRLEAGGRFAAGEKTAVIAKELRVSERSVEHWRRAWREGGPESLRSARPAKVPRISDAQSAVQRCADGFCGVHLFSCSCPGGVCPAWQPCGGDGERKRRPVECSGD